jgi:Meiotically up-regulated gene 113
VVSSFFAGCFVVCQACEDIPFKHIQDSSGTIITRQELLAVLEVIKESLAIPNRNYENYRNWLFCENHLDGCGLEMMDKGGFIPTLDQKEEAIKNERFKREQYKARRTSTSYVYVMQSLVTKDIKISRSKKPMERLKSMQVSQPHEIALILISKPINDASQREKELHGMFAEHRLKGEWFSPEVLVPLLNLSLDDEDFFDVVPE